MDWVELEEEATGRKWRFEPHPPKRKDIPRGRTRAVRVPAKLARAAVQPTSKEQPAQAASQASTPTAI